jgi:SMC interacting uncharacterized protein involved in chromosome segregation
MENNTTNTNSTPASTATTNAADLSAILAQIAKLEKHNQVLQGELKGKNDEVSKLSEKKRQEMRNIYDTLISKWVDTLEPENPKAKEVFKNGVEGIAEKSDDENGIWQVVMCASANALKKEEQFQALQTQYDELKTQSTGGKFAHEEQRVGSKRSALEAPDIVERTQPADIWDEFETFMKTENKGATYVA